MKNEKYLIALDLALGTSGAAVFDKNGKLLRVTSISTNAKMTHGKRLMEIGSFFIDIRSQYDIDTVAIERGFNKFSKSTEAIFKVVGVVNYIFNDCETLYYPPSTVKKIVGGNGRSSKEELREIVKGIYPEIILKNLDESDAISVGLCHFKKIGENNE